MMAELDAKMFVTFANSVYFSLDDSRALTQSFDLQLSVEAS